MFFSILSWNRAATVCIFCLPKWTSWCACMEDVCEFWTTCLSMCQSDGGFEEWDEVHGGRQGSDPISVS